MKRYISFFLVATLLLTVLFSFGGVAFASQFVVRTENEKKEAAPGETVTFTWSFKNDSGSTISDYIYLGTTPVTEQPISVANGETGGGSFTMKVTDDMLGKDLVFTCAGMSSSVKIDKRNLVTKIAGTAAVPRTLYNEGETVKFSFKIENLGETALDNIVISAPELNNGKALNSGFSLAPNSNQTVKFNYTMPGKDVTINPVINYSIAGGAAQPAVALSPVELTLTKRDVKAQLTVSNNKPEPGEEVTFTLTLTNGGNVPYKDIKVLANGEEQKFPSTLDANGTQKGEFKMSFQTSTDVSCSISLTDHTGAVKNLTSNTVSISLPVDTAAVDSKLSFSMSVDRPQLTSAGSVNFSGLITNATEYELTNIKVDEATLGNVYSADTLAAGDTASVEFAADINATATYTFVLTATDKDGNTYTKTADPVTVTIQSVQATATPELSGVDVTLAPDGNLGAGTIGTLGIIAIVLVVLIIGVGIALIVLWKKGQAPSRTTPPGRKKPMPSSSRKRPSSQTNYRDRNNF